MTGKKLKSRATSRLKISKDDILAIYLKEVGSIERVPYKVQNKLLIDLDKLNKRLKNYSQKYKIKIDELSYFGTNKKIPDKLLKKVLSVVNKRDMIKEKIIKLNLRLVINIAEKYKSDKLSLLDLISEGNIGLIDGIERYDVNLGTRLSTYVIWWIKQRISQAIMEQSNTIKLPVYIYNILYKCKKVKEKLSLELGEEPTIKELADKVSISVDKLIHFYQYMREPISLETEFKNTGTELKDFIGDSSNITPFEVVYSMSFVDKLSEIIDTLKYKEQMVIKMRFGLFGEDEYKLNEIGEYLGVSAERVRQILKSGLDNLKREILKEKDFFLN